MAKIVFGSILCPIACALGCASQAPVQPFVREISGISGISGTKAERAAAIARLFPTVDPYIELTDAIADARLVELKFGDGVLGPADYCSYLWIEIPSEYVERWKSVLQPTTAALVYDLPPGSPSWWLTRADFDKLPKYDSFPLFQWDGWVAVDDLGNIFARTCTR